MPCIMNKHVHCTVFASVFGNLFSMYLYLYLDEVLETAWNVLKQLCKYWRSKPVLWIRIRVNRIRIFWDLPDPDPSFFVTFIFEEVCKCTIKK
jgi:hypothetical protein